MKPHIAAAAVAIVAVLGACSTIPVFDASGPEFPPMNPNLVDSELATTHFNPAQQDSLPFAGPVGIHEIDDEGIQRVPAGLVNLTLMQLPTYPSGEQVAISANNNRISKILISCSPSATVRQIGEIA